MKLWSDVDAYISNRLLPNSAVLESVLKANAEAGLPAIDVSPTQAAFLGVLVTAIGARRVLEIGTLGGYSSICMAQSLPEGGRLVTLEYDKRHASVARENIERAGLDQTIKVIVGAAAASLPELEKRGEAAFDLVFIDADKPGNPIYLEWALRLSRPGALIVCDNVIRDGQVIDANSSDGNTNGARAAFDFISERAGLEATAIQTVGEKGYDGFIILTNPRAPAASQTDMGHEL